MQNCVADMPADMKDHILNHHTHFTAESNDIAQAHLATNNVNSVTLAPTVLSQDELTHFTSDDPLILTLSTNHQALRLGMSPGNPWLTTGIPMGKPAGMETRGSELPVITGLHGSGFLFWCCEYLAQVLGRLGFYLFILLI